MISQPVFCPCCCSTEDAQGEEGETIQLECTSCGQQWTMKLEASRFAAHSIS